MPNDMERSVKPEHSKVAAAFPFLFEADQPTSLVESDQDVEAFGHDDEAQPQAIAYRSDFFQKRVMMTSTPGFRCDSLSLKQAASPARRRLFAGSGPGSVVRPTTDRAKMKQVSGDWVERPSVGSH